MRYWLSAQHFTPVFEQGPLVLSELAGPLNPPPELQDFKGAWVVAMELKMAGFSDTIRIETVEPRALVVEYPNATAPATDALTTVRLSVGGKQLTAGDHELSLMGATVSAHRVESRDSESLAKHKIGTGFVEQINVKAHGLHLRITSAKANKFADEKLQALGLHLDLEFLTFDESIVRGALPEMWGLQPMSEDTKLLLDKKNVEN